MINLFSHLTNIARNFVTNLTETNFLISELENFNLFNFENVLYKKIQDLYNEVCRVVLEKFCLSSFFKKECKDLVQKFNVKKIKKRETSLQLRTGAKITIPSYYAGSKIGDNNRELFHNLLHTVSKASPCYYSTLSMFSVICPSFETANSLLKSQSIQCNNNRIRDISLKFSERVLENRCGIQLEENETLEGKNVVCSIDGGRTRPREYRNCKNEKGTHNLYATPWREPKLFVIQVIDEKSGKQIKKEFPIYDCTFGKSKCFKLLSKYLKKLNINKAKMVQFIADGAKWIWKEAKQMLLDLGVAETKIYETLDYYHGVEHLSRIINYLPKKICKSKKTELFERMKNFLCNGKIEEIEKEVRKYTKRINKKVKTEFAYFKKHCKRCRYNFFREKKLLCGSGIVESAIRRIINLRFKCPSSFWNIENVEGLIFLRATFLSGRWNLMIQNYLKN
jgi:hypothetical protein